MSIQLERFTAEFTEHGDVISVGAGAGFNGVAPVILVSRGIPMTAHVFIESLHLRVVDVGALDQLYFDLRYEGRSVAPWHDIVGEHIADNPIMPVGRTFRGGLIEIVASNKSGTTEAGAALDAFAVRCHAGWVGYAETR